MNTKQTVEFFYTFNIGCARTVMTGNGHIDRIIKAIKKQGGANEVLRGLPFMWALFVVCLFTPIKDPWEAFKSIVFLRIFSIGSAIFLIGEIIAAINVFRWENPKPIKELRELIYLLGKEWTVERLLEMKTEDFRGLIDYKLDELVRQILSVDQSCETTLTPLRNELGKLFNLCKRFNLITFDGWDPIFERVKKQMLVEKQNEIEGTVD